MAASPTSAIAPPVPAPPPRPWRGRGRLAQSAVAAAGVALGVAAAAAAAVLSSTVTPAPALTVAVALPVGWSFLGVGLYAWNRRPDNAFGVLMTAVAFAWFGAGLAGAGDAVAHTAGLAVSSLYYAVLVHLLLAFPSGRVHGRVERTALAVAYVVAGAGQLLILTVADPPGPANLLLLRRDDALAGALTQASALLGAAVTSLVAVTLLRRWRAAGARQRRALAPVLTAGGVVAVLLAAGLIIGVASPALVGPAALVVAVGLGAVPFAFLLGLARARFFAADAIAGLLARLARGAPGGVRTALADALGDATLQVAYWLPERGAHVDAGGQPVQIPPGRAVSPVERTAAAWR